MWATLAFIWGRLSCSLAACPRPTETGRELPPAAVGQDERRMQVRAYNFWASLLGDRNFPSITDFDPQDLAFGENSVLLDFTSGIDDPAISFLGGKLADECGAVGAIATLSDVPTRSLLSRITDHYMQILANQAPIGFEAEFVNQRGKTTLYRGILLPFSTDDATIDHVYGVINWKELADQQTTDELLLEIDQALNPEHSQPRAHFPLTEWADGPVDDSDVLELVAPADESDQRLDWSGTSLGRAADGPGPDSAAGEPGEDMGLADWLSAARELAQAAASSEDRSRQALYAAIGRAYDFALVAAAAPAEFQQMVAEAGLAVQERAPLTPVVKLVFGVDYDKTRLAEYAAALSYARRLGFARGGLVEWLTNAPGGLKGVVAAERKFKRESHDGPAEARTGPREALARRLRRIAPRPFSAMSGEGSEFSLLVARRMPSGEVALLGEVDGDPRLLERAARRLLG
jgi:hypothetical protein